MTTTITDFDEGWYNSSETHDPSNHNTLTGVASGTTYNSFFSFSLPTTTTVTAVTFRLQIDAEGADFHVGNTETLSFWDVTTDSTTLSDGTGGTAAFSDLQGGVSYGSFTFTPADNGIYDITLNADALQALNDARGSNFAIGVHLDTADSTATFDAVRFGNTVAESLSDLILTINAPATVTSSAGATAASEQVAVVVDSGLSVADSDNSTLASATVAITGNYQSGEDVLSFVNDGTTMGNITASYNTTTGVLSLASSGATATIAQWQAALRAVQYTDTSDTPSTADRTISFTVNDGLDDGVATSKTVTVAAVNDVPAFAMLDGAPVFTEGGPAVVMDGNVSIFDAEMHAAGNYAGASLTLARHGGASADDAFGASGNLSPLTDGGDLVLSGIVIGTVTQNSGGTLLLTFNSNATEAAVNETMRALTYQSNATGPLPSAQIDWTFSDGTDSVQGNVTAINDAPVVETSAGPIAAASFPVVIDPTLAVSDFGNTTLASATVAITSGFEAAADALAFTNNGSMGNIAASYNSATGVLTLTSDGATATLAQWQAALQSVTYAQVGPKHPAPDHTITFTLDDGTLQSAPATKLVTLPEHAPDIAFGTQDFIAGTFAFSGGGDSVNVFLSDGVGGFSGSATGTGGGNRPLSGTLGDVNGDGHADIVVANYFSDNVSVLIGDGAGQFTAAPLIGAGGSNPYSTALADVTGDGKLDIVTANIGSNTVSVLGGDGTGQFAAAITTSTGGSASDSVAVGDVNSDGKLDVVTANHSSNNVSILTGDGTGHFTTTTTGLGGGSGPSGVALGDINNDGKLDIVTANGLSNNVSVLIGDGAGHFAASTVGMGGGLNPFSVALGDLNNDGQLDIVTANLNSGDVSVLLANGSGGYSASTIGDGIGAASYAALGDFNGDGNLDIAVADEAGNGSLVVLFGDGHGGFTGTSLGTSAIPTFIAVGDIDGTQSADEDTALIFNSANHNPIMVSDADGDVQTMTLSVSHGALTLATTAGLTFSAGDGTSDATMTFAGSVAAVNAALAGLSYLSTLNYNGDDTLTVSTSDGVRQDKVSVAITVNPVDDPAVAKNDAFSTTEAAPIGSGLNVLNDNGSGADSDVDSSLAVTAVNGVDASVGQVITLSSGALLRLNSNGTFSYNPNHAFDFVPAASSGASNTSAADQFTYTVNGGGTATVTITLTGIDSNDILYDLNGHTHLSGGIGNDQYFVTNSADVINENTNSGSDQVITTVSYQLQAGSEIELLRANDAAGTSPITLIGNEFAQTITGNAGSNTLKGGGGMAADVLSGLGGNDFYYVTHSGDRIVEAVHGGTDRVYASVNYTLTAGAEVEALTTDNSAGTNAITLIGNEFAQTITGNAGNNTLKDGGGTAVDTMSGLGGNDYYYVTHAGDHIVEAVNGGSDRVYASVNFTLNAGAEVEMITTDNSAGTSPLALIGNEFAQTIVGNAGNNTLKAGGGTAADVLRGLDGNDYYYVSHAGDHIIEGVNQGTDRVYASVSYALNAGAEIETISTINSAATTAINLTGNEFAQSIVGNAGNNTINGGLGNDTLTGAGGNDNFLFNTALNASTNVDRIVDFTVSTGMAANVDKMMLDDAIFAALNPGHAATPFALSSSAFTTSAPVNADQHIVYSAATGALSYDDDGSGAHAAVQFATVTAHLAVTNADFIVV